MANSTPFLSDVKELRKRARQHMQKGAITENYKGDVKVVIDILNQALATEIVCVLRYKRHYYTAKGINKEGVAAEFLQHAAEEQGHADQISERITQLGGDPDLNPEGLASRSHSEYVTADDLVSMIKENLVAERIAIESYSEIVRYLGTNDPTTRRMMEGILAVEEEHANDMLDLLAQFPEIKKAK
ncbi:MAG: bacterioferritin [Candidatus Eremiobacteraeota bacterium]|nr:bacterioferritin [Candidatus Eremiobacteraeota bacterium]